MLGLLGMGEHERVGQWAKLTEYSRIAYITE